LNAAAEKSSIGSRKTNMTVLRDGANQVRGWARGEAAGSASPDPNDLGERLAG